MSEVNEVERKTMNETDNFDKWFEAQHGPRPYPHGKDAELSARIDAGIEAMAIMRDCDMYDARRTSALYAWTANTYRYKRRRESEKEK